MAHVCRGARILERLPWRSVFPQWISYSENIELQPTARAMRQWGELARTVIEIAAQDVALTPMKLRIQATYLQAMASLWDKRDKEGGDLITILHFQQALGALQTSED